MDHDHHDLGSNLFFAECKPLKAAKSIELDKHHPTQPRGFKKLFSQRFDEETDSTITSQESTLSNHSLLEDGEVLNFLKPHAQIINTIDDDQLNKELASKNIHLIRQPTKPVLILDLDGTLLITSDSTVFLRPYLNYFLQTLKNKFSLWVWTAGDRNYLHYAIDIIDPEHSIFEYTLDGSYCTVANGVYIKDARMFENLDLRSMVIMDDQLTSFITTIDNGILVSSYQGDAHDNELLKWLDFLLSLDWKNIPLFLYQSLHIKECLALLL